MPFVDASIAPLLLVQAFTATGGSCGMISACRAKRKSGSWSHPSNAVPITACKPLSSASKVGIRRFQIQWVDAYEVRCSIRIDAGYGEKVLFAAVDEEAADENESSKIEDEVLFTSCD